LSPVLASITSSVVVPLIVGLLGGVLGGTLTRVTSRNDVRRDKYADALSALRVLQSLAPNDPSRPAAQARLADLATWLELDGLPVGDAFKDLLAAATAGDNLDTAAAREKFISTARAFSRWTLPQRTFLQYKALRERRRRRGPA